MSSPEGSWREESAAPGLGSPKKSSSTPRGGVGGLGGPGLRPKPTRSRLAGDGNALKRERPLSTANLARLDNATGEAGLASSLVPASTQPETMADFFARVLAGAKESHAATGVQVSVTEAIGEEDGLYLHKRPIRGLGPNNPLAVGGSVFHHVLIYIKSAGKLQCLDYGPDNMNDVTSNFMEEAEARPVLMNEGGEVTVPSEDTLPFLHIKTPLHSLTEKCLIEAFQFCDARKYHVIHNNCIQNADFLVRVLTGGLVKNAPLIYDAMCGDVPKVDPPMLMMLPILMQKTWQQICDGSQMMREYLQQHSVAPIVLSGDFISPSLKRQEGDSLDGRGGGSSCNGGEMGTGAHANVDTVHYDTSEKVDERQFNNFNYWGRPYLDRLHVVEDSG